MNLADSVWPRRIVALLLGWLMIAGALAWLGSSPTWLGVLAAVAAVFGFGWFVADVAGDVAATAWTAHHPARSDRPTLDGRLGTLRRLAETAAEPTRDGSTTRPAAAELQTLLRRVTELRTRDAPDAVPPDLAAYLSTTPAPLISAHQLDQLLSRIEAL